MRPWEGSSPFNGRGQGEAWSLYDRQDKARGLALRFVSTLRRWLNDLPEGPHGHRK